MNDPPIAVVIPALNEASHLAATVSSLAQQGFETIIVVDGGSDDDSATQAEHAGALVIRSTRGRGVQMNTGAALTTAPVLLFLHADTRLPPDAAGLIRRTLLDPAIVGGCFRLRFDRRHLLLNFYGAMSRFETPLTTFGDQAYFIRASAFRELGGFPEWPFLEDVELRRRLRRLGKFVKLPAAVVTSARRFNGEGILRRQVLNGLILLLHQCGVSPWRLIRWYRVDR